MVNDDDDSVGFLWILTLSIILTNW